MFWDNQRRFGHSKQLPTSQRKPARHGRQLFRDDEIVFDLILQSFSIFDLDNYAKSSHGKQKKDFNQGFGGFGAHVGFVPFVVLFNFFWFQFLDLLLCELQGNGFLDSTRIHLNCKLFTKGWNVGLSSQVRPGAHHPEPPSPIQTL